MWVWESEKAKGIFVLVHGANEYHARYQWLIQRLVNEGYHVVMGDLPGQGLNPKIQGHIESFDEYMEAIEKWYRKALEYKLPIFLLGHSMGGLAVIQTMIYKKLAVKAVILSSPCLGLEDPPPKLKHYSAFFLNKVTPKLRLPTNLAQVTRCEEMIKRDETDHYMVKKVSVRWYCELTKAMADSFDKAELFPDVPLIILQGGMDLVVDKKAVFAWFDLLNVTHKTYEEFPSLYHEVFNEPEKETVFDVAKQFIESI